METKIASSTKEVTIGAGLPTVLIGERINPAGKKSMAEALKAGDFEIVRNEALAQTQAGADIIDVNTTIFGADEANILPKAVKIAMETVDTPLCIDSANPAAVEAAQKARAKIEVVPGVGEALPFEDNVFDAITSSEVLCTVTSLDKTLIEFKRVLRPGGQLSLFEHVRSEHFIQGHLMDLLNPIWFRLNKVGCNWNRKIVDNLKTAGFRIRSVEAHKIYSKASPASFPLRIIKADLIETT